MMMNWYRIYEMHRWGKRLRVRVMGHAEALSHLADLKKAYPKTTFKLEKERR